MCIRDRESNLSKNKKHLKNAGPIRHCELFYIAIHQVSLHAACASMSTTTTTTTRDRGDRCGPMELAQQRVVLLLIILSSNRCAQRKPIADDADSGHHTADDKAAGQALA